MQKIKTIFIITFLIFLGGCNIYFDYVERGYAADAKTQLKSIYEASKLYRSENGYYPGDIDQINDGNYLNIPQSTLDQWYFEINIEDDGEVHGSIIAISLEDMPGGAGQYLEFDLQNEKFTGYGQRDDGYGHE